MADQRSASPGRAAAPIAAPAPAPAGESEAPIHQRLTAELADALAESALRCEDGEVADLAWEQVVRVKYHDVVTAARCQAKAAAPADELELGIHTTHRAVAVQSVQRLRRSPTVLAAVSETMSALRAAQRQAGDRPAYEAWLGEFLADPVQAPIDVRVRIAAKATTWLTTALDVLGVDDPAQVKRWRHDIRPKWRYPGRGLTLEGRVDLALPVDGNFTPVFVLSSLHPAALDAVAFAVCLWSISQRRPADEVLLVELPTATLHRRDPAELYDRGVEAAARAADAVTRRGIETGDGPSPLRRTPSGFVCADCAWAAGCPAKSDFDGRPVQRGGIQLSHGRSESDTGSGAHPSGAGGR